MNNRKSGLIFIISVFVVVILLIVYGFNYKNNDNFNYKKIDKSKYLIYTVEKRNSGDYHQFIPFINVVGDNVKLINDNIAEYIESFTNENTCITYEYSLSGNVLSLIIKVEDHSYADSANVLYFRSYNYNIRQDSLLSNEEVLGYFDITVNDALDRFNSKLNEYYNNLKSNNLISSYNCDFNCFCNSRGFTKTLDDAEFFVKEGKLFVYKPYTFIQFDSDEEITYGFQVAE